MTFRIRYALWHPPHGMVGPKQYRCRLFVGPAPDRTFSLCGELRLKPAELEALKQTCPQIRFVDDDQAIAKA